MWQPCKPSSLQALGNERNFRIVADGGLDAECHSIPVVDTTTSCAATTKAPNMWDLSHKIYTVFKLPNDTFAHGCVDAEFPHFPYAHYVEFSAFFLHHLFVVWLLCGLYNQFLYAGKKFYSWLNGWHWDLSSMPDPDPRQVCMQRYDAAKASTGPDALEIDACACDAIVTDCHRNAVSPGEGEVENSAPFNVFNSAGAYRPPQAAEDRKEWWNAASREFSWRHECATICMEWWHAVCTTLAVTLNSSVQSSADNMALFRFPQQHEQTNAVPPPSMGVEGLDEKYARGKYPREAWPWDRADPHADAINLDWAKPAEWDGIAEYNAIGKLNTSIYELYVFVVLASQHPCAHSCVHSHVPAPDPACEETCHVHVV